MISPQSMFPPLPRQYSRGRRRGLPRLAGKMSPKATVASRAATPVGGLSDYPLAVTSVVKYGSILRRMRGTLLGRALQPLPALLAAALGSPGCHSNGQATGDVNGRTDGGPIAASTSVLEHHGGPSRAGVYTQARVARGAPRLDPAFHAGGGGLIFAPPPFLAPGGPDPGLARPPRHKGYSLPSPRAPT